MVVYQQYVVGEIECFVEIVGDQQDVDFVVLYYVLQQVLEVYVGEGVDCVEWFVE